VLSGAATAALFAGLSACVAPPALSSVPDATPSGHATPASSGPPEPLSSPSQALYVSRLIVQRAEPSASTRVSLADWRFRVSGRVGKPLELTYDDLGRFPKVPQTSALHCVEGWSVADLRWEGIRLATLLEAVEPAPSARWLTFDTFPGVYRDSLSIEQARLPDVLLAYRLGDAPLTDDLGFPLRLIVPRMHAYKSVKWLSGIRLVDAQDEGFWEQRGYPADAWFS
jgi:DMSO/TMAO reductase YedYZ molybdopterin-dependent catalytic subunit